MKTLIRNGHIVTAVDSYIADILIDGATVVLIGKDLEKIAGALDKTIDATHKLVIPGGIDPHTHMDLPFGGTSSSDDFETGTRAAAVGGTTTIVDFGTIFKAMTAAGEVGGLICMHAENGVVIDVLVKRALAEGKTAPKYHALTRPTKAEAEGTGRAIALAEMANAPVYIVHLSNDDSLQE